MRPKRASSGSPRGFAPCCGTAEGERWAGCLEFVICGDAAGSTPKSRPNCTHTCEMVAQDVEQTGISQEDARRRVRLRFGNPVRVREQTVAEDTALELEGVWRDSKLALRQLRRSPGFALTAVLTLGLGIGAT